MAEQKTFDRKLLRQGSSKVLTVTRIFPDDWYIVRISVLEEEDDSITIQAKKLVGENHES